MVVAEGALKEPSEVVGVFPKVFKVNVFEGAEDKDENALVDVAC